MEELITVGGGYTHGYTEYRGGSRGGALGAEAPPSYLGFT